MRIALLLSLAWMMRLTDPLFSVHTLGVSGRDLILLGGGLFLLAKSVLRDPQRARRRRSRRPRGARAPRISSAPSSQIAIIDIVFSLDSVITAVGMVDEIPVMVLAIVIAVGIMMFAAKPIGDFVDTHPTIKMLALSFLILIGVALVGEGFELHIPKGYIYFAMAFAVGVEMLNLRLRKAADADEAAQGPHRDDHGRARDSGFRIAGGAAAACSRSLSARRGPARRGLAATRGYRVRRRAHVDRAARPDRRRQRRRSSCPSAAPSRTGRTWRSASTTCASRCSPEKIARALGNALVAPVSPTSPKAASSRRRRTCAFRARSRCPTPTFEQVLESAARSFKLHGFRDIVFLGDSRRLPEEPDQAVAPASTANGRRRRRARTPSSSTTAPPRRRIRSALQEPRLPRRRRSARMPGSPIRRSRWRSIRALVRSDKLRFRRTQARRRRRHRRSAPRQRGARPARRRRDRRRNASTRSGGTAALIRRRAERLDCAAHSIRNRQERPCHRRSFLPFDFAVVPRAMGSRLAALAMARSPGRRRRAASTGARPRSPRCPACRRWSTPPTSTARPRRAS